MYGMPTLNINGTMLCNGVPIGGDGSTIGSGTATAKYYLYPSCQDLLTRLIAPQDTAIDILAPSPPFFNQPNYIETEDNEEFESPGIEHAI